MTDPDHRPVARGALPDILEGGSTRPPRPWARRAYAGLTAAVVIAAGATFYATRTDPPANPPLQSSNTAASPAPTPTPAPDPTVHTYEVAYASGTTIHGGDHTTDTGVRIRALTQTPRGYVIADPRGRVHTVINDETTRVGQLTDTDRGTALVSDGDIVAWVDAADGGTLTALDIATGDVAAFELASWPGNPPTNAGVPDGGDGRLIVALDERAVYVADSDGVMAWNALDGEQPVLLPADPSASTSRTLDVQAGLLLYSVSILTPHEGEGSTTTSLVPQLRVGNDLTTGLTIEGEGGRLTPDGKHVLILDGTALPSVVELATGERRVLTPDTGTNDATAGGVYLSVYQWLDANTVAALSFDYSARKGASRALLACDVHSTTCIRVTRVDDRDVVLPTGQLSP
ncbi:hypothetical protein [Nocardioides renjunii]|uniref:hypothetical protein n=1 Tax=Nocardioides renjunii TaxID=3095075 RepID=UPI002AFF6A16|nr:hypothetical protein [Nocardioides sp. S-34]WQQ20454.1 hypothetical protein SHK17_11090 [Nocardioides sp. S-34]